MSINKPKKGIVALIIALIFGGGYGVTQFGALTERDCTISAPTAVVIGQDLSVEIFATSSRRASATIQQPENASSTAFFSLDRGTAATVDNGLHLTQATTTSPVAQIIFGLKTDLPYTGAVQGITNGTASSTVLVTECNY